MEIDRGRRVGELIQRKLALIINSELSDPRIGIVTVTDVKVTKDLKQADVFVTEISNDVNHNEVLAALDSASGYLKRLLSKELDLRFTPNLKFIYDVTTENGLRLTSLIDQARDKDSQ